VSTLAVAQFAPGASRDENLARMTALADEAVQRGATLVVFPEYSSYFTPELSADWLPHAEALDGPFVSAVGRMARERGIHVVAGLVETADDGRMHNTLAAVGPDGTLLAVYRKLHLYDAFGGRESDVLAPGALDAPQLFAWGGFTVGMQTCYDIRFPEVSRRLVDAGADVLLVPAEWVNGPLKEHHWRTLLTARALENTVYLAAADHAPPIGVGASIVVDPMGVVLADAGERAAAVEVARLDRDRMTRVREINPALRLRRFGVIPVSEGEAR